MTWSFAVEPLLPAWLLAAAAILSVLLIVPGLLRRQRGAWLRAAAVVILFLALLNPVALREDRDPLPTVVAVVTDQSASQSLDGRDAVTAAARTELEARLAEFRNVEVRTIDAGAPGGMVDGTMLFGPLAAGLADVPPERLGAVVMLTDGQVHDVPESVDALGYTAPVHALLSGHDGEVDRRLVIDNAPRFGIVGESQVVRFRVLDDGSPDGGMPVRINVTRDGNPLSSQVVTAGEPQEFRVDITHGGANIVEFEAEPLDGELTEVNNRAVASIEGIRENLRVLLVSGEPHAGERTWRNLLKSDAAVDLVHFTILRPPEKQDGTPINQLSLIAFPTRELFSEKIDQFDLIIFDRYQHRGVLPILYFDNIARYVRDGGAVLIAAGPDYMDDGSLYNTPLSPVLPAAPTGTVTERPFHAEVTPEGERHPVTRDLEGSQSDPPDWGRWFRLIDVEPQTAGTTVMDGPDDKPLLVLNRVENGRVALLLSDHAWLWARGYEGGGPHVDLLRRLAHWLMQEPDLEEEALRARARGGELVVERQTMAEETGPVTVRTPSGAEETVTLSPAEPGLWRATLAVDEIGLYRVEQGERRAFAHVGAANPREFTDARSTDALLRPIAQATGGHVARMADAGGTLDMPRIVPIRGGANYSGSDWIGVRMTEASVLQGITRVPLFGGYAGPAAFLALLVLLLLPAVTWFREGR
jgi:hypothetical protein